MTSPPQRDDGLLQNQLLGVITVILTLIAWSVTPLFIKHFAGLIDWQTSNGWRYGFAALLWLPVIIYGMYKRSLPRGIWLLALVPGLINSAGQICFTWAHYKIDPGLLTFGLRSQMVFVAIGAYLLFPAERELLKRPGFWLGLLLVIGGTIGTVLAGTDEIKGDRLFGVLLAIGAGAGFAGYGLAVRYYMNRINPVVAFAVISQYTAVSQIGIMLIGGENYGLGVGVLSGEQFGILLLSAVIGIALGHVLYYLSIQGLGVAVSAGVIQLQPFGVAVGSYFLFSEVLTVSQWVSGMIAVAGAMLMLIVQRRMNKRPILKPDAEHVSAEAGYPLIGHPDPNGNANGASADAQPQEPAASSD